MNLIQRVQDILLKPKGDLAPGFTQESADTASIYSTYLIFIAAVPAVAGFIGLSIIGAGAFGISIRIPLLSGLLHMVVSYVLSLAVYGLALIVDALAPTPSVAAGARSARSNWWPSAALPAFWVAFSTCCRSLSVLGLLAALYSIYLIYTGLPVLMKCPGEKAVAYTAVVIVCGIVAMVILAPSRRRCCLAVACDWAG